MQSLQKKVSIAAVIMMGSILLSRLIGLLREMVIAYIGGAGGEVDAYQIAFVVPEILNHMLASGFLSVTFIPIWRPAAAVYFGCIHFYAANYRTGCTRTG
jgi:putative peptidoglycan lipid II flippase